MALQQGTVVIATDQFKGNGNGKRPYIIVSNRSHPFHGQQYLCMSISTNNYDEGVLLKDEYFVKNDLFETSYASPWTVVQIPSHEVVKTVGRLKDAAVESLLTQMFKYVNPDRASNPDGDTETNDTESRTELLAD